MQIRLNSKCNEKMLQNFPDDPYSDLCIVTQTRRLNLVLAYLAIDSIFFANIDPDTRQINLKELNQQPLIRILRSLYGEQLVANTISELNQLYQIIIKLEIQDYKTNLQKEVHSKPYIMESIQFLEFSFPVIQFHIDNNLKTLQSNRNYLQLNKITLNTFHTLLNKYIQSMVKKYGAIQILLTKPQSQIINHVMENYFNRNNIKAGNYFKQQPCGKCPQMEMIWAKYHHTISFGNDSKLMGVSSVGSKMGDSILKSNNSQFLSVTNPLQKQLLRKKSQEVIIVPANLSPTSSQTSSSLQLEKKKHRLQQLEQQLKQRDAIISQLQRQIAEAKQSTQKPKTIIKKPSGSGNQLVPQVLDEEQLMKSTEEQSLSFLPSIKKARKSKDLEQEDFTVSSVFEPAFNNANRKIPEMKQVRTMKKVINGKAKFLPD